MVKKILACILCLFMVGCSTQTTSTSHKIKVVTTTFPSYDALRAIIGNDPDYDLHQKISSRSRMPICLSIRVVTRIHGSMKS